MYVDPDRVGIPCELVRYQARDGHRLIGLWFQTPSTPAGTVVHFHGNFGNVSNHFLCAQFLTHYGFDVLVFDYEGYGGSQGRPSPQRTFEDGIASVDYALRRDRSGHKTVAVFGQSLGGAVATVVAARNPRVSSVVLEAPFSSYRGIARDVLKRSVLTWILYPFAPWFIGTRYDPEKWIANISPRPLLIIHGDADKIVPSWMSERLYKIAKEPKRLWIIKGAGHLGCRAREKDVYEKTIAEFFRDGFKAAS